MELMIVISIIGIVSTVAVWTASNSTNRVKEAQLKTTARTLIDVHTYINSHDSYHRFLSEQDDTYLNHRLESLWESETYGNVFGHRNPYSKSPLVLNRGSIPASLKYPAVFITSNNTHSYDEISQAMAAGFWLLAVGCPVLTVKLSNYRTTQLSNYLTVSPSRWLMAYGY